VKGSENSMAFDSVQVRFRDVAFHNESPFANTRVVPFVDSYFEILKGVVNDIKTEYFWFFSNFVNLNINKGFDLLDYIPEQHEKEQIHVWYTTHPMGGLNKEGNIFLIPTKKFKEQMHELTFLRDYEDINYHAHATLFQQPLSKSIFQLTNPMKSYNDSRKFYTWMINKDLGEITVPNFYPSFWEDEKMYTWGKTKDILLIPGNRDIKQFYDIERSVQFDLEYDTKPMDIIFISYHEPGAEKRYKKLKEKFPRAKWVKDIPGQTIAYLMAAATSETAYFFAVFPKIDIVDEFQFDFQPDRLKNPSHYIFDCYNEVIDCTYGHDGIILFNKKLVMETTEPGLDFTLSKPVTVVPILSAVNKLDETPLLAWRTSFREVIKLTVQEPTVEGRYRLKKWCTLGKGKNASWVHKGATDAIAFVESGQDLKLSYDFDWIKSYYEEKYG